MRKVVLFFAVVLIYSVCHAQNETVLYNTYDEFVKGAGDKMDDDWIRWTESTFGRSVKFNKGGAKVKYQTGDFWGFIYHGQLFRCCGKELGMLLENGKITYWINGFAGLDMISRPDQPGSFAAGESECFLSVGPGNAKMYRMPIAKHVRRDFEDFKKDYPQFAEVTDCMDIAGFSGIYASVQKCVHQYNLAHKSVKDFQSELAADPNNSMLLHNYGQYFLSIVRGTIPNNGKSSSINLDSAFIYLKKAYDIDPKNALLVSNLSLVYMLKGNCDEAWRLFNMIYDIDHYFNYSPLKKELKANCKK